MPWDMTSARACVVKHPILFDNDVLVLSAAAHATLSPYPYGVGVYSVDSTGKKTELPLYYVSPTAASEGYRNVTAGWYVAAVPGQAFELRLTAVQPDFPKVDGKDLKEGHGVNASVLVDGTRASKRKFKKFCQEETIAGFTESKSQAGGTEIRKLEFSKAVTSGEDEGASVEGSGAILVKIISGKRVRGIRWDRKYDLGAGDDLKIAEREAMKGGKTI